LHSLQCQSKIPYFLLKNTFDNFIPLKTDDEITRAVESFNNAVQQVAWSATPINSNLDINIEYSVIKEKLAEKRKLRKLWQTNRCPVMKNKLNRGIKAHKIC
jgi:hypothetical protein